jgi:hypothetical protein
MGAMMTIKLDAILDRLAKVPEVFNDRHWDIAQSLAAVLIRDRMFDEAVWLQVQRYAIHRVKWDDLQLDVETDEAEDAKGFGSAKVQRIAYLDKVLTPLERELFVTPAARKEGLGSEQASFMDLLDEAGLVVPAKTGQGAADAGVTPFRPRRRLSGG